MKELLEGDELKKYLEMSKHNQMLYNLERLIKTVGLNKTINLLEAYIDWKKVKVQE